jgi:hypothetical protein
MRYFFCSPGWMKYYSSRPDIDDLKVSRMKKS